MVAVMHKMMKKYSWVFVLFILLWSHSAFACGIVRFHATGNWTTGGTWDTGVAPTACDDVQVGTDATTGTLTMNGTGGSPNLARSVSFTGFTGTFAMASAVLNVGDASGGSFTMVSGTTVTLSIPTINFVSTTTGNTITAGGKSFGIVNWNGVGGAWTFQDNYTASSSRLQSLLAGTLDFGNHTMNIDQLDAATGNATRVLNMGSGTLTNTGRFTMGTLASGLTVNASTSTLALAGAFIGSTGLGLANQTYSTITMSMTNATNGLQYQFTGGWTAATVTITNTSATRCSNCQIMLSSGATTTVTGTFTLNGDANVNSRIMVESNSTGSRATLSVGTLSTQYSDWSDITAAGAANWNLSAITGLSGDGGNNSGITTTTPATIYAKTAISRNFSDSAMWFTTSGGSTPARVPLLQDTARFDASSITAGSLTISGDMIRMPGVNWTGVTNSPVWAKTSATYIAFYGDVTLSSGMTHTGTTNAIFFSKSGNISITNNGCASTWGNPLNIYTGAVGTVQLQDNLVASNTFLLATGGLDLNGHTFTGHTTDTISGGTLTVSGQMTSTGAVTISGGTVAISAQLQSGAGITLSGGTTTDSGASGEYKGTTFSCTGGTHALRKFTMSSTFSISSTCAMTLNPGVSTWVTSFTETGTTHSLTYNGTFTNVNGTLTVTASTTPTGYIWAQ